MNVQIATQVIPTPAITPGFCCRLEGTTLSFVPLVLALQPNGNCSHIWMHPLDYAVYTQDSGHKH